MSEKYKMNDTRKSPRLKVGYLMKYMIVDANGHETVCTANTTDISTGGVCFLSNASVDLDALIRVKILVPPIGGEVTAFARVCKVTPLTDDQIYSVGLSFIEISKNDHDVLAGLIDRLLNTREAHFLFSQKDRIIRNAGGEVTAQ